MVRRLIPTAVAIAAVAVPAAADAQQKSYKVIKATHSSSSSKSEETYTGRSTAKWSLTNPTSEAPNRVTISKLGTTYSGLGQVNVKGSYSIDATTDRGHCAWTTSTGDTQYPGIAPSDFTLAIGPNPQTGRGILASFIATQASLSNAYLGSECSTSVSGEPDGDETSITKIKPSQLKKKKLVLRFKGSTSDEGIDYSWSTTIVLKRR
jgi:hypothetical protein